MEEKKVLKKHKLGVFAVAGTIYTFCCAGAYGIEDMIPYGGPGMTILALCVLPFIWAYPQALVCAELGSAIPEEGGIYKWIQRAFGEFWGFLGGYWLILVNYLFVPTLVLMGGDYMGTYFGWPQAGIVVYKILIILVFGYINWRGLKDVAILSTIMAIIIFIAFMCIIVIGFSKWQYNPVEPFVPEGQGVMMSASYAFAIGMWMYAGYTQMGNVAGELENPQVIPKALMVAMPVIILTYIPTTVAGLASYGHWEEWGTDGVSWIQIAGQGGPVWGAIFVGVGFLGLISIFNSYLGTSARTIFVMAEDNLAPKIFRQYNKKTGVPEVALLSIVVVSVILSMFEFSFIATLTVTVGFLEKGAFMAAAIYLRHKEPDMPRPFKVGMSNSLFTAMCVMFLCVEVLFLYLNGTDYFFFGALAAATGPLVYWLSKKSIGGGHLLARKDLKPFSILFAIIALIAAGGFFFFPFYDDPSYFEWRYGSESVLGTLVTCIGILAAVSAVLAVVFYTVSKNRNEVSEA
ncbi:MAG: APC family permease [Clostridiales bacterium]|nr:APC family permease [Clostridiales bacterium]